MTDLEAVRQACRPIARWWRAYERGVYPDPAALARATARARLLGAIPGALGEAITYIVEGCQDLNYPRAHAAFNRVAAAAERPGPLTLDDLEEPAAGGAEQLCLAGIPAPMALGSRSRRRRR